jgi:hypothetical protein
MIVYSIKYLETCGIEKLEDVELKGNYLSVQYPHSPNGTVLYLGKEAFLTFKEANEAAIVKLRSMIKSIDKKRNKLESQLNARLDDFHAQQSEESDE